jgi:8-oxo-dGTP pyrophosphatase MutT (NUDIX family)
MSDTGIKVRRVVSNFIFYSTGTSRRLLLLKRSEKVRNYQGLWCTVSGSIDGNESASRCAIREIGEEIGVPESDLTCIHEGSEMIVEATERQIHWHVTPFIWSIAQDKVTIDWEHTEYKWIDPDDLNQYELVPDLIKTYHHVLRESSS